MTDRPTDERIAYIIAANATAYVEPETLEMAREIQQLRARLAAVLTFIEDLRKPGMSGSRSGVGSFVAQEIEDRLMTAELREEQP